jgi:uncharacterized membrane protein
VALPAHPSPDRAFALLDPRRATGRLALAWAAGVAVALSLPRDLGWAVRAVAGWDVGASVLLGLVWLIIAGADCAETRRRASAEDPGRTLVWGFVLVGSTFSLLATTVLLHQAKEVAPIRAEIFVAMCIWAVACAWALTHSAFALRYARLYYREDDGTGVGGLGFPGDQPPDDLDFAYFAFTLGMCFQTSDVTVIDRAIRRTVLMHGVLSFIYNTAILALALNLVFGRLG